MRTSTNTPAKAMAHRYERIAKRLTKYAARLKAYGVDPKIVDSAGNAVAESLRTKEFLLKLPDDWRPARGSVWGAPIVEGSTVRIREAFLAQYGGLFDDRARFMVEQIVGGRVRCELSGAKDRTVVVFPRTHVQA